ncbi:MAG: hypothetical protein M3R04_08160, partial [bacterium]|nr:hypothetical protein [bacterium]
YKHPWFLANRMPGLIDGPQGTKLTVYTAMPTMQALSTLNAHEKAFFWLYNFGLVAIALFLLWLGWRVLTARKTYPSARREITWS